MGLVFQQMVKKRMRHSLAPHTLTFMVSKEEYSRFKDVCEKLGGTQSQVLRAILGSYLDYVYADQSAAPEVTE